MSDLTKVQKVRYLGQTLTSVGWANIIKPALEKTRAEAINLWVQNEKPQLAEQYRMTVAWCEWMLSWEHRLDKLAAELEQMPQTTQQFGGIAPRNRAV